MGPPLFLWDGIQIIAEYDSAGNRVNRYAYIGDDLSPIQTEDATGVYSVHYDFFQTPKLMTSSTEMVVWRNRMQVFGASNVDEDPDGDNVSVSLNIRFPGQYFDEESAFFQNVNREYDPTLGRYLQSDPIGQLFLGNSYTYANSNSLLFIDPAGLQYRRPPGNRIWPALPPPPPRNTRGNGPITRPWKGGRGKLRPQLPVSRPALGDKDLGDAIGRAVNDVMDQLGDWGIGMCFYEVIGKTSPEITRRILEDQPSLGPCDTKNCRVCILMSSSWTSCTKGSAHTECEPFPGSMISNGSFLACFSFSFSGKNTTNSCPSCE